MTGWRRHIPLLASLGVWLLLYAIAAASFDRFFTLRVFVDLFEDNAALGLAAIGMTLVILAGGIDLSVGSVMALASITTALLIQEYGWHPAAAIVAALLMGACFGGAMGATICHFDLPPFIVTLAGMFFARGLALIIHLEPIAISNDTFFAWRQIGLPLGGGEKFPLVAIIFVVVLLATTYLALSTELGRSIYAVGGSEDSARLMGLRAGRTKLFVYAFSGLCSAGAGVVFTFYQLAGNPSAGVGLELDAIAAVVVGGTLLAGGVGSVPGTLIGVLMFGLIQAGITFHGQLNAWWTRVTIGVLLLVFVVLQRGLSATGARGEAHSSA